jgi:phospholipid transport system substrate-binding protein
MGIEFSSQESLGAGAVKALSRYALILLFFPVLVLAGDQQPVDVIRGATGKVLAELNAAPEIRRDTVKLSRVIQEHILPHVDFVSLSRLTLGKHWQRATQEQRSVFAREFGVLLIKTYSTALAEYTNQEIEYLSSETSADKHKSRVRTRIVGDGRAPLAVDYSLRQVKSTWKIYDLTIEGVSLAINYRASFSQQIRNHGIDGLIERLRARNTPAMEKLTAAQTFVSHPQ